VDEERRAIVSAFVADRSVFSLGERMIATLGETLGRVHALPLPASAEAKDARQFLAAMWSSLAGFAVPSFVGDAVARVRAEAVPPTGRADVLSHNDVNPSNLVYDGEHVMLLDWDAAGRNEPFYDLAAIAVFLRMDAATCLRLLSAHDGAPVTAL